MKQGIHPDNYRVSNPNLMQKKAKLVGKGAL